MNLEKLFYYIKVHGKVTDNIIKNFGVSDEYLEYLLDQKILKKDNTDYILDDINQVFMLGREELAEERFRTANTIFDCCYSVEPDNFLVNYQLFYKSLIKKVPKDIFKHFDIVYNHLKDSIRKNDVTYYLFLLGHLYELPDRYKAIYNNISLDDILLEETDGFSIFENTLRKNIYNNSYSKVDLIFNERFDNPEENTFEDDLEKELLLKIFIKNRNLNKMIYRYINDDKFIELKKLLDKENEKKFLTNSKIYILKLVNQYNIIETTNKIPDVIDGSEDIYSAVDNNDYDKALNYAIQHKKEHKYQKDTAIYLMLQKIIRLISVTKNKNSIDEKYQVLLDAVVEMRKKPSRVFLSDEDKKFLEDKINELYNGRSVYILEPMDKTKRDLIHDFISKHDDIVSFNIGTEPERRVVLRYKPHISEYVNIWETVAEAKKCYVKGDYIEAAKKYELLLKLGTPRDVTYAAYGLTLLKLKRNEEAIDCLRIATILSKEKDGKLDYTDLIKKTENSNYDYTQKINMHVFDFKEKNDGVYSSIVNDVIGLMEQGDLSINEACTKLNLSLEDINYIKLLYARDCYYLGKIVEGDLYFKQVEKSKNKNKKVKDLYKDILLSKKYYSSRLDAEHSQLVIKKK